MTFIGSYFAWFVYLYFLAGYLRLFQPDFGNGQLLAMIAVPLGLVVGSTVLMTLHPGIPKALGISARYFSGTYSFFLLVAAVGIFAAFGRLSIPNSKVVNGIASTTFGVYLIHDNGIVRPWLWPHFSALFAQPAAVLLVGLPVLALCVFAACGLVDYVRQLLARVLAVKPLQARTAELYRRVDRWYRV